MATAAGHGAVEGWGFGRDAPRGEEAAGAVDDAVVAATHTDMGVVVAGVVDSQLVGIGTRARCRRPAR